jgi:DNA-binding LacI/PurR family transcriptional regulator
MHNQEWRKEIPRIRRSKVTLKSIAADLGITHTSVSNAYNNPTKISAELRKKILAHAETVNYFGPSAAGRSLRTGVCGAIGVIFNDQLSYAFTDAHDIAFLRGISSVCEENGTNIVLIPLKNRDFGGDQPPDAIVDGYILNAPYKSNAATQRALAKGLPIVAVDFDAPEYTSVLTNDSKIMNELTEHLLSLGHQRLGIATFPVKEGSHEIFTLDEDIDTDNYVVKQRLLGCREAIAKTQIKLGDVLVCEATNCADGGAEAARRLLERQPDITAIICFSDRLAFGAMTECKRLGLDVPQRISVTGFDDIEPLGLHATLPSLTTARQNAYEKGRKAAEALLHEDGEQGRSIEIEAIAIIRDSTAQVSAT